ncbi:MAG: histidinol-phosphatase [Clostridia bacterium]|nr:histidinol-phosphatase [Clostridia bacterium]
MIRGNFHTHSTYCDGKSTLEETVLAAIESGMDAVGFSGHAHTTHDSRYCMTVEGTESYRRDIMALKEKYKDKIEIYCGLELDYFSDTDPKDFDYTIGSVHYVVKDGVYHDVDGSEALFDESVQEGWNGDPIGFAVDYFAEVADIIEKTNADIIGHFDLVSKFNENFCRFDENDPRYVAAWMKALDKLIPAGKLFEINTGAISRGYRTEPYPARPILKEIVKRGGKVILTADCHQKDTLEYGFEDAIQYAKECGVTELYTLSGNPIKQVKMKL